MISPFVHDQGAIVRLRVLRATPAFTVQHYLPRALFFRGLHSNPVFHEDWEAQGVL